MGDRANVAVETRPGKRVFFYTHWGGHDVPATVKVALERSKPRWGDPSYFARMVFCTLCTDLEGETGYGIDTGLGDNGHDVFVLCPEKCVVELHRFDPKNWTVDPKNWTVAGDWKEPMASWTFEEYCALPDHSWEGLEEHRTRDAIA
jgi:hypothetical protein